MAERLTEPERNAALAAAAMMTAALHRDQELLEAAIIGATDVDFLELLKAFIAFGTELSSQFGAVTGMTALEVIQGMSIALSKDE